MALIDLPGMAKSVLSVVVHNTLAFLGLVFMCCRRGRREGIALRVH